MGRWSLEIFKGAGRYRVKYAFVVVLKSNGQVDTIDLLNTEGDVVLDDGEYAVVYYLQVGNKK